MLPITAPVILKLNINGIIGTGKLTSKSIQNKLLDSREGVFKEGRVKGILLHFDTPGGGVTESNGIYEMLNAYKEKYKIPVYGYVDGMCASGGMYIASSADRVYASQVSIIGSVGVILGPVFNFYDLMEKWGVKAKTIAKGKDKAMLNPFTQWKEGEDDSLIRVTDYLYKHFVDLVAKARPNLNKAKLIDEYGAQVYVAPEAAKLGFIDDGHASYEVALADLAVAAGLKENEKYQVVELKTPKPVILEFLEGRSPNSILKGVKSFFGAQEALDDLSDPFLYLYQPSL